VRYPPKGHELDWERGCQWWQENGHRVSRVRFCTSIGQMCQRNILCHIRCIFSCNFTAFLCLTDCGYPYNYGWHLIKWLMRFIAVDLQKSWANKHLQTCHQSHFTQARKMFIQLWWSNGFMDTLKDEERIVYWSTGIHSHAQDFHRQSWGLVGEAVGGLEMPPMSPLLTDSKAEGEPDRGMWFEAAGFSHFS